MMSFESIRQKITYLQPQGSVACCTASATLLAAEIILSDTESKANLSRLFLYYMTRKDSNRLDLKGAELRDTMEALKKYGAPPERFWPFTSNRVERLPSNQAMQEAIYYRLQSYESITPTNYKEFLDNGIPVIIGMRTGKLFWNLKGELSEQKYKPINDTDNTLSMGHAITIVGYDDNINEGSWIIANSLGPQWGHQGYATIPYSCNVDIGESYVITKFAGITPIKNFLKFDK